MTLRLLGVILLLWSAQAAADLYRWVDPETGSVKFSSYPPPWFGDPEKEKRAPKVEQIPGASKPAPASPDATPVMGASLEALEVRRKQIMQELAGASMQKELQSGGTALKGRLEAFAAIAAEMDRLDPRGADQRRSEARPLLEKLVENLRTQQKPAPR